MKIYASAGTLYPPPGLSLGKSSWRPALNGRRLYARECAARPMSMKYHWVDAHGSIRRKPVAA